MYYTYEGEPVEVISQTTMEYELYRYKGRPKHAYVPRFKEGQEIPLIPVMEDKIEPDADKLDFTFWKTNPYEHQKEFLKYSQSHAQMLLLDEPGLGKTKQSLDLIANRIKAGQIQKALIIVGVSSLQYNWLNEVKKHTNLSGYILGTRAVGKSGLQTKIGSGRDKVDDVNRLKKMNAQVVITNIESLRNDAIITGLMSQINDKVLGMVVVDEVHKCKNPKAKQTKGLLSLNTHYKLGLTGTPIVNSPVDLFAMMLWLGRTVPPKTYFEAKYCIKGGFQNKQITGFKNTDDLSRDLNCWSLRRTKDECLDLPEKTVQTIHFDMLPEQARLYKEIQKDLRERSAEIMASASPMGQLVGLKKATGCPPRVMETFPPEACAKLEALLDIVEEVIAAGQKIVIFCYHVFTLEYLNWVLRKHKYNPALVYGAIDTQVREANVQAFQNIPECNIILGNYQTLGTGFNLTASSTIVEYELPWTSADEIQAQDRCHRIGQHHPVNIIRLVTNHSYDIINEEIVDNKEMLADSIINADLNYQQQLANRILNMI
jgi:SWI/SNF-related matrix-associated actin-dependent regulator 1 of chromatin subfamily A